MGFLSPYKATEKVDLGDSFYALVRVHLTTGQELAAQHKMMGLKVKYDDKAQADMSMDFDQGAYLLELVAQAVVEWNLTDENENVLPFATVDQRRASAIELPKWAVDAIVSVIKDKPRGKNDDEKPEAGATFPNSDAGSSPEGGGGTA